MKMLFEDQGGTRGYNHNAATTKTGEDSEADGVRALARNKEGAAPQTNLNSLTSNDFESALAPAPTRKTPTVDPWPPDPGEVGATMGHSFPPDPDAALARNKEGAAPQTKLNSLTSNDFASALAPAPARKIPTVDPWPPDPG
eukprot:CAMPEP_0172645048 /NCGR_PEP_ID=MMETSP1068-20121228/239529_1 /TAXON_ID=35684 /ORGANISM="Pseudopedinella elastica, Strain CCMP716" /LENGTH=141 /DNA_ID=CAMNT_0013459271 /DNA_START=177 /DNA_END=601 /DNA_ORIENTATION=+